MKRTSAKPSEDISSYEAFLSRAFEPIAPRPDFVAGLQQQLAGAGEPGGGLSYSAFTVGLSVFLLAGFAAAVGLVWGLRALIVSWQRRPPPQAAS
jgi:hypothetical protein